MKPIFIRAGLFAFLCTIALGSQAQTRTLKYNTIATDNCHGYYEYLPAGYNNNPNETFPLIIYLHGIGTVGDGGPGGNYHLDDVVNSGWGTPPWRSWRSLLPDQFTVNGKAFKYILITPQFIIEAFTDPEKYVGDFLNYCVAHYKVDPKRIYLLGQSGNATAVLKYAGSSIDIASKIAGVAVSSPAGDASLSAASIIAAGNIPVWLAASRFEEPNPSTEDPEKYRKFAESWYNAINNSQPKDIYPPRLTLLDNLTPGQYNGHNDAAIYLYRPDTKVDGKNLYEWLFTFEKQSPLPVTGLTLKARNQDNSILIYWKTFSEHNNKGFNIQQSSDGVSFKNIGFVAASGSANGASYAFTVADPLEGTNYFRLEQIDINGGQSFSTIETIQHTAGVLLRVAPNPVSSRLKLNFSKVLTGVTLQIFDNSGRLQIEKRFSSAAEAQIDVSRLARGNYNGRILSTEGQQQFSFIKN